MFIVPSRQLWLDVLGLWCFLCQKMFYPKL